MAAPKRDDKGMQELFPQRSSELYKKHRAMIDKMLKNGYTIDPEFEKTDVEEGLKGELIRIIDTVVLKPPRIELPMIKFQATQTFGKYDFETEVYQKYDGAAFEQKAWKKSAELNAFNAPWQDFDIFG